MFCNILGLKQFQLKICLQIHGDIYKASYRAVSSNKLYAIKLLAWLTVLLLFFVISLQLPAVVQSINLLFAYLKHSFSLYLIFSFPVQ